MQTAQLHRYAANVSRLLADFPGAMSAYAAALKILDDLATRHPDKSVYRNELALALSDRAMLEKRMGKLKDAAATLDRSLGVLEGTAISGKESPYRRTLTVALLELDRAEVAYRSGRFDDFSRYASRGSEMLDSLKTAPAAQRIPAELLYAAIAVKRRGMALRELGDAAGALALHDDSVARMKNLNGPKASRDVLFHDCESRRERALTATAVPERRAAAAADLDEVIKVNEKLVTDYPQIAFYREGLAGDYLCRGELLTLLGKPDEAAAELAKSLAVSHELLKRHGNLSDSLLVRAKTYLALGKAQAAAGKNDEAQGHWKSAITMFETALKADPDNAHHRRGLAEARTRVGPPR
jgi:tetratricopeptide (TPR) repeat protein